MNRMHTGSFTAWRLHESRSKCVILIEDFYTFIVKAAGGKRKD